MKDVLLRTLVRSSGATYVVPALIIFVLVALGQDLTAWTTPHYWPSAMSSSLSSLPFVATISAGLGAWEGARLARGGVFKQTNARSPLSITAMVLAPIVLGAFVACLASLVDSAVAAGVWALPDWRVLVTEILLVLANTLAGYCVGRRLNAVVSVPVSLVGAFVANAYPDSWSVLWLRHLVGGGLTDCCDTDQVLAPRAIWAAVVFSAGIVLACGVLIGPHVSRASAAMCLALFAVGTAGAAVLAHPVPASPVAARPDSQLLCERQDGATVCLWPEVSRQSTVRTEAATAARALRSAGVAVPSRLTMSAAPARGASKLGISVEPNADDTRSGVISGLIPPVPRCAFSGPYPAATAAAPVAAWMSLVAGDSPSQVSQHTDAKTTALAQGIRKLSPAAQKAWYLRNISAMKGCTSKPQLSPEGSGS